MLKGLFSYWKLIVAGVVLAACVGAYMFVTGLVSQIATLEAEKAALETAKAVQDETISGLEENIAEWEAQAQRIEQTERELQDARIRIDNELRRLRLRDLAQPEAADAANRADCVRRRMLEAASGFERNDSACGDP